MGAVPPPVCLTPSIRRWSGSHRRRRFERFPFGVIPGSRVASPPGTKIDGKSEPGGAQGTGVDRMRRYYWVSTLIRFPAGLDAAVVPAWPAFVHSSLRFLERLRRGCSTSEVAGTAKETMSMNVEAAPLPLPDDRLRKGLIQARAEIIRGLVLIAGAERVRVRPVQGQTAGPTPEERLGRLEAGLSVVDRVSRPRRRIALPPSARSRFQPPLRKRPRS